MYLSKLCWLIVWIGLWGSNAAESALQTEIFPLTSLQACELQKVPATAVAPEIAAEAAKPILDFIAGAQKTLHGCVYKLDYAPIIDALIQAKEGRGVDVTLFVESNPFQHAGSDQAVTNIAYLKAAGITVLEKLPHYPEAQLHAKFLLADNARLLLTTINWDQESFLGASKWRDTPPQGDAPTRDVALILDNPALVRESLQWLQWLEKGIDPHFPAATALNFGPLRSTRAYMTEHLNQATKSVHLWQQSVQDDVLVDALIALQKRGVSVSLVMTADPFNAALKGRTDGNLPNLGRLAAAGVQVHRVPSFTLPYIHMKGALIDGKTFLFTTANFYKSSLDQGFEVSSALQEPKMLQVLEETFQKDVGGQYPLSL